LKTNELEFDIETVLRNALQEIIDTSGQALPDPTLWNHWYDASRRRIWIPEVVNATIIEYVKMITHWNEEDKGIPIEERKPIWVYVFCYGGELEYMWALIDAIEMSDTPVYTVNVGLAGSAGSLIFMAGKKRFMTKNAKVVVHEGSAQLQGDAIKVLDAATSYKEDLTQMKSFILAHTRIDPRQLNKKRANDWTLDAKYCLENGVCDAIVDKYSEII